MRPPAENSQEKPDKSSSSAAHVPRGTIAPTDHMAATLMQPNLPPPPQQPHFVGERPTLPPIAHIGIPPLTARSLLPTTGSRQVPPSPVASHGGPPVSSLASWSSPSNSFGTRQPNIIRLATTDPSQSLDVYGSAYDPRGPPPHGTKRPFEQTRDPLTSSSLPRPHSTSQSVQEEEDDRRRLDTLHAGKRMSLGSVGTNADSISSVHSNFGGMQRPMPPRPQPLPPINASRYNLHLRQQPRAARAGPDGKDRRAVDPPPVLQLLIDDFDPESEEDMADMKNHFWVVHTKLIPAQATSEDAGPSSAAAAAAAAATAPTPSDVIRGQEVTRLLLGTTVSSPFFCADDPDPDTAPKIPTKRRSRSPSPTSRFITSSKSRVKDPAQQVDPATLPATFFIFADLSIRKAGEYKLEFRLMRMDPANLQPGSIVPTISSVTSQTFRVVNAKDFDQVQPSTNLVRGLLDRGAGFPLKLKKGIREGQRRRNVRAGSDGDSEDDGDDSDEEEDG